jgi:FkbM family methyltransferase
LTSQASRAGADEFKAFKQLCEAAARNPAPGPDPKRPIWIFGAGGFGRDLCACLKKAGFQVKGFIQSQPSASTVSDLPVKTWSDFSGGRAQDQLAFGIFNHVSPFNELEALARSAGFKDLFMPWDLYPGLEKALGWRFWLSAPGFIADRLPDLERAYYCLEDDESRRCFLRTLAFRLGKDTEFASFQHPGRQYFNDITFAALPPVVNYVDGGAYNGDTFLELLQHRKAASAYLFEPDPKNFKDLVAAVEGQAGSVHCLPLGLMDDYQVLSFKAEGATGSAFSDEGTAHLSTVALDQVIPGHRIDFIKMDIEGSELAAIKGAARLIRASRPLLALSLYHRPDDLWRIPLELLPLCPDYKFFIRQHCFNSFESVLYAVPQTFS